MEKDTDNIKRASVLLEALRGLKIALARENITLKGITLEKGDAPLMSDVLSPFRMCHCNRENAEFLVEGIKINE